MRQTLKTLLINTVVLLVLLGLIELFFGSWVFRTSAFDHLNIVHDREIQTNVESLYANDPPVITYRRDPYGIRGASVFNQPQQIDILSVGGSTSDQRFLDEGKTWQDQLERKLAAAGLPFKIGNAGLDGQSSYGHIRNFEMWYPLIPDLQPQYILYYVGFNDIFIRTQEVQVKMMVKDSPLHQIKARSAIYNLLRKLYGIMSAHKYSVFHAPTDFEAFTYTTQRGFQPAENAAFFGNSLDAYAQRLEELVRLTEEMGAEPIFITQPCMCYRYEADGTVVGADLKKDLFGYVLTGVDYFHILVEQNKRLYQVAEKHGYPVIELTERDIWTPDDFYDIIHNTPAGAEKIADELARELIGRKLLLQDSNSSVPIPRTTTKSHE